MKSQTRIFCLTPKDFLRKSKWHKWFGDGQPVPPTHNLPALRSVYLWCSFRTTTPWGQITVIRLPSWNWACQVQMLRLALGPWEPLFSYSVLKCLFTLLTHREESQRRGCVITPCLTLSIHSALGPSEWFL